MSATAKTQIKDNTGVVLLSTIKQVSPGATGLGEKPVEIELDELIKQDDHAPIAQFRTDKNAIRLIEIASALHHEKEPL